ncbi:MAG: acyl-CoA thioesterase domain-containing protein [Sphingobium sp.]
MTQAEGQEGDMPTARELLMFDEVEPDCFRARHTLDNMMGATFGGQLLGQALAAAQATVDGWSANSLNGYFFRGGKVDAPLDYCVERISDCRRFASRRVTAMQHGRAIFGAQCSFHDAEDGAAHQVEAPADRPDPDSLPSLRQFAEANPDRLSIGMRNSLLRDFPIELRPLRPGSFLDEAQRDFWVRIPSAAGVEGDGAHQALLALLSDYWLPGAIATRHNRDDARYSVLSLNHSLWFHRPSRADQWLLYTTQSDWAGQGRGLARGLIFDRDGALVATAMQEALLRAI